MKKSELERIIKEEVQNILNENSNLSAYGGYDEDHMSKYRLGILKKLLDISMKDGSPQDVIMHLQKAIETLETQLVKEGNVFPMWESGNTVKQFTFGYDIDNVMAVQEYLIARYKVASNQPSIVGKEDDKEPDCKLYFGYGDDSINAVDIYNSALLQDKELRELINSCEGEGTYEEGNDNELNESIKHFQKLAGIITEEYGVRMEDAKLPSEDFSDLIYKDMWEDHLAWAKANRTSNRKNAKYPSEQKQEEYLFSIAPKYGVDPNILKKAIKQYNSLHDRTYGMIPGGLTWQEWTDAKIQSLSN